MTFEQFYEKYPLQSVRLSDGKVFRYRYYKHPTAERTLVLLTGGIGLSDLLYLHFDHFAKDFSVMTFDYQTQYDSNRQFVDAVAELLRRLDIKAWLVGQSLGGFIAQIIAKEHPDVVDGLVLSNTGSLSADMNEEAYGQLMSMIEKQSKSRRMLKMMPFGLYKKVLVKAVMKKVSAFEEEEKQQMREICDALMKLLTKEYELHMIDFLVDAKNHFGMKKKDFAAWKNRVLLILSDDDDTFNRSCKDSLIQMMSEPQVVTNLRGGHLALLIRLERYADIIKGYITTR